MRKSINILMILVCAVLATGCESDQEKAERLERNHQIRLAKIANGQDAIEQEMRHERSMARIQQPIAPGAYIDYRGNTQYGYWNNGSWAWNNPQSQYAIQSRSYVDYQMATGLLGTAVLTQALWNSNNSDGWQQKNVTVNNYTSTTGKTISKTDYAARTKAVAEKRKARLAKTVVPKTTVAKVKPVVKKPATKWESKRTTSVKPTYAKGGFNQTFAKNKQKATYAKNNLKPTTKYVAKKTTSKPRTTYKKSSYSSKSKSKSTYRR